MKNGLLLVLVTLSLLVGLVACDAVDTDVLPVADNTYDVGSGDLQWANGYFGTGLFVGGIPVGTGTGDVVGPDGATGDNVVTFDGVTGKLIQDSGSSIADFTPLWVADANGVHYTGNVGIHTSSSAAGLLALYSSDGISNDPILEVMDNSASAEAVGIRVNIAGAKTEYADGIYITNTATSGSAGAGKYGLRIRNTGVWDGVGSVNYGLYIEEPTGGTGNIGIWNDGTTILNGITTLNEQLVLAGDGKVWIELRPELDFEIVKKSDVPVSYTRGLFSGFELPIWADDAQELFFDVCVPDRWDGVSTTHIHLDVFLIDAQDDGDDFKLQIGWEHYNPGVDVVPDSITLIPVQTETGASAAFQSFHVHFDVPAGDMLGDDMLAFRVRRIATGGTEISGNVVIEHAGVIFLCNKLGNVSAE